MKVFNMLLAPKFLFVPVSGVEGIGEYMRSIIIAKAVLKKWPSATIEFILNKHAPYAADCPFTSHLLDDTPTNKVSEVNQIVSTFKPDVVIFDASGRKSQLQHAYQLGAKVVFISQHKRKRRRGMKIGRARSTHLHWVAQPKFVLGEISLINKIKLALIKRSEPQFIGPVFCQPIEEEIDVILAQYGLVKGEFTLFNAGSGGHKVANRLAADIFVEAASDCYQKTGVRSIMVLGPNYPAATPEVDGVIIVKQVDNQEFINLLMAAKFAVLGGGDTLLQGIALKRPMLTCPVSKDQPARIKSCADIGLVQSCDTKVESLTLGYSKMLAPNMSEKLINNMNNIENLNGLEICIAALTQLLEPS